MCRLYGFRSAIYSGIHQSLVVAENALARLSEKHRDGWGISYYIDRYPHLIRNDQQAMGDSLFREISAVVSTRTFMAHIRQATTGEVRVLNCHPFQHGCWSFAHNGEIAGYKDPAVQARMREGVDERFRRFILGDTDSEILFHIFLSQLARRADNILALGVRPEQVLDALADTLRFVRANAPDDNQPRINRLSLLVTNGSILVGYRFRRELFYSTYKSRCPERDTCYAFDAGMCEQEVPAGIVKHLILASERLSDGPNIWTELNDNEYVCVDHGMNFCRGILPE